MGRFAHLILAAADECQLDVTLMLSHQNEEVERFDRYPAERIIRVDTFSSGRGALTRIDRVFRIRERLAREIQQRRASRVVFLMPHVWGPLISGVIPKNGAEYGIVVHDATPHPGDPTGRVHNWIHIDLNNADRIFTLSQWVADELSRRRPMLRGRIVPLIHPNLGSGVAPNLQMNGPIRLAFLGRILPYKGLPLLVEALEILRKQSIPFEIEIVGEGDIEPVRQRLDQLGAKIKNEWVSEEELARVACRCDLVVASHLEASQSGVVAFAFGHGVPVLATPEGALPEQVTHKSDGLIARETSASAIAEQIIEAATGNGLLVKLREGVAQRARDRTMAGFLKRILSD